jgi:hypothetical protein
MLFFFLFLSCIYYCSIVILIDRTVSLCVIVNFVITPCYTKWYLLVPGKIKYIFCSSF